MLSQSQSKAWNDEGFLVLENFVSDEEIVTLQHAYDQVWKRLPASVVVDDLHTNRRTAPCLLNAKEKRHRFKVNDLYLNDEQVRNVVLSQRVVPVLRELLSDDPGLCNTLSLNYGTQQGPHADSLFMTPVSDHKLVATWIAMEDGSESTGPLSYYPGSHKIPIYRFSTGKPNIVVDEFSKWEEHIQRHMREMGLQEKRFIPKRGDMLIWSAQLIHGGSPILDERKTRKSIVSHFFSLADTKTFTPDICPQNGGYWQNRPAQAISEQEQHLLAQYKEKQERRRQRIEQVRQAKVTLVNAFERYGAKDLIDSKSLMARSGRRLLRKAKSLLAVDP